MPSSGGSFATFLIICPTSFFLGILFSLFPYDYPLLWTTSPTPASHIPLLEAHLQFLHSSPPIIPRILHIVIGLGLLGFFIKLYKPSESNYLFDGASLILYMCGVVVYLSNTVKGLRTISEGTYDKELVEGELAVGVKGVGAGQEKPLGKEENMKVLAASNTILALVLVGVLVLQAGQWYAERKEGQEVERMEREGKTVKGRTTDAAKGKGRRGVVPTPSSQQHQQQQGSGVPQSRKDE